MKIFVSNAARGDLLHIYSYIAERNPDAAEAILQTIDRKFEHLSRFPFLGRERSAISPGLRSALAGMHLIFYRIENDRLIVVRVLDGRMDIDEELQK